MLNLIGKKYGRLVVVGRVKRRCNGRSQQLCKCRCDCGKTSLVFLDNLRKGGTKSCGCMRRELAPLHNVIHGETIKRNITPEFNAWAGMKARCYTPSSAGPQWKDYGGRGIRVCRRWLHSYSNFLADMGRRPTPLHTLDRINSDRNYTPKNCRWATRTVQNRNQRRHKGKRFG